MSRRVQVIKTNASGITAWRFIKIFAPGFDGVQKVCKFIARSNEKPLSWSDRGYSADAMSIRITSGERTSLFSNTVRSDYRQPSHRFDRSRPRSGSFVH